MKQLRDDTLAYSISVQFASLEATSNTQLMIRGLGYGAVMGGTLISLPPQAQTWHQQFDLEISSYTRLVAWLMVKHQFVHQIWRSVRTPDLE